MATPTVSCLGGALVRRDDGWHWQDDDRLEPRVRDLCLRDLGANFRCITYANQTYVEVPRYWRDLVRDDDVAAAIAVLVSDHGRPAPIYAEGVAEALDDHRRTTRGYLVPVEAWDTTMRRPVGAQWDQADEAAILARAAAGGVR